VLAVDEEPVGRPRRQARGTGDRMLVGGRLEVGRDAARGQHVEQMLADARVDVAGRRVLRRDQPVVASPTPASACWHAAPLPGAPDATIGSVALVRLGES
jgi:hypothetical protein